MRMTRKALLLRHLAFDAVAAALGLTVALVAEGTVRSCALFVVAVAVLWIPYDVVVFLRSRGSG